MADNDGIGKVIERLWLSVLGSYNSAGELLCFCETLWRDGILSLPNSPSFRPVPSFGVAGVYTPLEKRRKGYAGIMLTMLAKKLRKVAEQSSGGFSVLFSGVGRKFMRSWAGQTT